MLAALVNLNHPGHYLHWGFIQLSLANFIVIVCMVVVFLGALVLPFPASAPGTAMSAPTDQVDTGATPGRPVSGRPEDAHMWTARLRGHAERAFPPDKLLPDRQPSYVASWIYVFGVLTLAAFTVILISGVALIVKGPSWWHVSKVGLFFNSIHMWSVELFFFFMVIHLWGKYVMAAWRGRRRATWVTGVVAFVASIGTAFTGYLSQQNFDSQWIGTQGKDGLNAVGVGAYFNILNFGQMLLWHVLLLPIVVGLLVVVHVLLVRRRGVVHPLPAPTPRRAGASAAPVKTAPASPATPVGGGVAEGSDR